MSRSNEYETFNPKARPSPAAARTLAREVMEVDHHLLHPCDASSQRPVQERTVQTGQHGLGAIERERPHPGAESRGQDHGFQNTMSPTPPDARKQGRVRIRDVVRAGAAERAGGFVDRGRRPLDLQEGPDRSLVDDDLDVAPVVRLPILLVPEDLPVARAERIAWRASASETSISVSGRLFTPSPPSCRGPL